MATIRTSSTSTPHSAARPFNSHLSLLLDEVIIELETTSPTGWRRRFLQAQKTILEVRAMGWAGGAR